jgi:hypothetical protein
MGSVQVFQGISRCMVFSAQVGYLVDRTLRLEKSYNWLGGLSPCIFLVVTGDLTTSSKPNSATVWALTEVVVQFLGTPWTGVPSNHPVSWFVSSDFYIFSLFAQFEIVIIFSGFSLCSILLVDLKQLLHINSVVVFGFPGKLHCFESALASAQFSVSSGDFSPCRYLNFPFGFCYAQVTFQLQPRPQKASGYCYSSRLHHWIQVSVFATHGIPVLPVTALPSCCPFVRSKAGFRDEVSFRQLT